MMKDRERHYGGVIAAFITPCRTTGEPDPKQAERLSSVLIEKGCHGIFAAGSTGEQPMLDGNQRRDIIAAVRKGAGDDALVFAGISGCGTRQALKYAANARNDGADVAVIMAPFFLSCSQEGLLEYVRRIADESPLPVGVYNHVRMPSQFSAETVMVLAEHENIVAIKDTDTDQERSLSLAAALAGKPIAFFQGREPFLLDSFNAGVAGCVSALANIAPELHRKLYDAVLAGDTAAAAACQKQLDHLIRIFELPESRTSFAAFCHAIKRIAVQRGWLETVEGMLPGYSPTSEHDARLLAIASEAGLELQDEQRTSTD